MNSQTLKTYQFLLKWLILAMVAGVVGGCLVQGFVCMLTAAVGWIKGAGWLWIWPFLGALVTAGLIYRIAPKTMVEGMPSYILGVRDHEAGLPLSVTFFKFWAALAGLSTFVCGGMVGPMGRTSSGVMSALVKGLSRLKIGFGPQDRRVGAICGLSAAVGALFHSPIGAGILAVEIIQRASMGYRDLFPGIMAGCSSVFMCKAMGWDSFYSFDVPDQFMDIRMVGWLILCAVLTGFVGGFYEKLYEFLSRLFNRGRKPVLLKVLIGCGAAFGLGSLVHPGLPGTSREFMSALIEGRMDIFRTGHLAMYPLFITLLVVMFSKLLCNCIVVGSGMSAGFTATTMAAGMLLGASFSAVLGIETGSATYYAFLCAGFTGMLSGSMNIPIASAVMAVELFGLEYSFAGAVAAVISFQMSRGTTLFQYATDESVFEGEEGHDALA